MRKYGGTLVDDKGQLFQVALTQREKKEFYRRPCKCYKFTVCATLAILAESHRLATGGTFYRFHQWAERRSPFDPSRQSKGKETL